MQSQLPRGREIAVVFQQINLDRRRAVAVGFADVRQPCTPSIDGQRRRVPVQRISSLAVQVGR
jgi:hypothetical protein